MHLPPRAVLTTLDGTFARPGGAGAHAPYHKEALTMKVYQVIAEQELHHEIDPTRGAIVRSELVLKQGSAAAITGGEYGEFEVGPDGSFDVPDELGEFLLKQPGWYQGVNPLGAVPRGDVAEQANKAKVSK